MSQISLYNQIHMILRREWENKTDPANAAAKINARFKRQIITPDKVFCHWYTFFDQQENTELFDKKLAVYSYSNLNEPPKNLHNSLLWISDDEKMENDEKLFAKDGRFLIICYWNKKEKNTFIDVYDLLKGEKGQSTFPFNISLTSFSPIHNNYLLVMEQVNIGKMPESYILKIDYSFLTVSLLKKVGYSASMDNFQILPDQLDSQKFIVHNKSGFRKGHIQENGGNKVFPILSRQKSVQLTENEERLGRPNLTEHLYGQKLMGNKMQYFVFDEENQMDPLNFCEFDLETLEKEETKVPNNLGVVFGKLKATEFCWSDDKFYASYKTGTENNIYHGIFMFDTSTFEWTDIQIFANGSPNIFVDENENLFLSVKSQNDWNTSSAYYRICLRKPEKLENLARLFAMRESNLYGNKKYLNVAKKLEIQMDH